MPGIRELGADTSAVCYSMPFDTAFFVEQVKVNSKLLILNNFNISLTLDYKIFLGKKPERLFGLIQAYESVGFKVSCNPKGLGVW
jgi:hypothetical protein